jgi:hypothetical protein
MRLDASSRQVASFPGDGVAAFSPAVCERRAAYGPRSRALPVGGCPLSALETIRSVSVGQPSSLVQSAARSGPTNHQTTGTTKRYSLVESVWRSSASRDSALAGRAKLCSRRSLVSGGHIGGSRRKPLAVAQGAGTGRARGQAPTSASGARRLAPWQCGTPDSGPLWVAGDAARRTDYPLRYRTRNCPSARARPSATSAPTGNSSAPRPPPAQGPTAPTTTWPTRSDGAPLPRSGLPAHAAVAAPIAPGAGSSDAAALFASELPGGTVRSTSPSQRPRHV